MKIASILNHLWKALLAASALWTGVAQAASDTHKRVRFLTSPKMSPYLLFFALGDFKPPPAERKNSMFRSNIRIAGLALAFASTGTTTANRSSRRRAGKAEKAAHRATERDTRRGTRV